MCHPATFFGSGLRPAWSELPRLQSDPSCSRLCRPLRFTAQCLSHCGGFASARSAISGFSARVGRQRAIRAPILPSLPNARASPRVPHREPHVAGSPRDRVLAEWMRDRWREYGLEHVEIVEHEVLLPTPPRCWSRWPATGAADAEGWRASMKEDAGRGRSVYRPRVGLPYHAYSASRRRHRARRLRRQRQPGGLRLARRARHRRQRQDRAGPLLRAVQLSRLQGAHRASSAARPDPDLLRSGRRWVQEGQDVSGRPVGTGEPYSARRHRLRLHGARRSADAGLGVGARRTADRARRPCRCRRSSARRCRGKDARVILDALGGPDAPPAWQGGLPITYRVGARTGRRAHAGADGRQIRPIWTVTGTHPRQRASPDELVIVGNHRDAWVYGGVDPSSGTASMMELARSLGTLASRARVRGGRSCSRAGTPRSSR